MPLNISFVKSDNPTVGDLHSKIEQIINVKREDYILKLWDIILDNDDSKLEDHGLSPGSIMFLTEKGSTKSSEIKKLDNLEKALEDELSRLACIQINFDFLSLINSNPKAVENQTKELLRISERCLKNLELADSAIIPTNDKDQRKRRKQIVNNLNDIINSADTLQANLNQL